MLKYDQIALWNEQVTPYSVINIFYGQIIRIFIVWIAQKFMVRSNHHIAMHDGERESCTMSHIPWFMRDSS